MTRSRNSRRGKTGKRICPLKNVKKKDKFISIRRPSSLSAKFYKKRDMRTEKYIVQQQIIERQLYELLSDEEKIVFNNYTCIGCDCGWDQFGSYLSFVA